MDKLSYRRHRFPNIVIQQAVWLYFRFALSYRDVEDMLNAALSPSEIHSWTKSRAIRACEKRGEANGQNYCHGKTCCSS